MPVINKSISPVQTNTSLVEIVSGHVILSQSRNVLKGNCPFHQDTSASFMISPTKNIFKCFGCGKEGGPAEFVMLISGKS